MILRADELIPGAETKLPIWLLSTIILFKPNTGWYQTGITVSVFDYTHVHAIWIIYKFWNYVGRYHCIYAFVTIHSQTMEIWNQHGLDIRSPNWRNFSLILLGLSVWTKTRGYKHVHRLCLWLAPIVTRVRIICIQPVCQKIIIWILWACEFDGLSSVVSHKIYRYFTSYVPYMD
jgi:hypothetical protein